jgi:uncharacterized protein (DUF2236 family)
MKHVPLGPDSLSWRYSGDLRAALLLPRAALLEAMHPVVGAGLADFSRFMADPWGRGTRTRESMITSVYGGPAAVRETARLRTLHRKFSGTDERGRSYSALDPEAYAWVWATVFQAVEDSRRLFARPLAPDARLRLYGEFRQVGGMLGVGEANMPPDPAALDAFCRRILLERLEQTPYSRDLVRSCAAAARCRLRPAGSCPSSRGRQAAARSGGCSPRSRSATCRPRRARFSAWAGRAATSAGSTGSRGSCA